MSMFDQFNWQGQVGFPYFWGYYWIGPINPHILPPFTGFTDTITGAVYYLVLNTAGDHLQLTTVAPPGPQRVLGAGDFLYMGQFGVGLQVVNGHLTATVLPSMPTGGPGPFAPNVEAGVATLIGGLFGIAQGRNSSVVDHISVQVATVATKTTPSEPSSIAPVVTYQGYYYEIQDANRQGNLT